MLIIESSRSCTQILPKYLFSSLRVLSIATTNESISFAQEQIPRNPIEGNQTTLKQLQLNKSGPYIKDFRCTCTCPGDYMQLYTNTHTEIQVLQFAPILSTISHNHVNLCQ